MRSSTLLIGTTALRDITSGTNGGFSAKVGWDAVTGCGTPVGQELLAQLAGVIDAGLNGLGTYAGKAFFFRGDRYVRYDWAQDKVDEGYPLPVSAWHLPGEFASGIDTALNGLGTYAGKAFFFRGDQYVRYDWAQDKVDEGYPLPVSVWHLGEFASGLAGATVPLNAEAVIPTSDETEVDGEDRAEVEAPLTIAEAKRRLAITFGVDPSAIKITVEG